MSIYRSKKYLNKDRLTAYVEQMDYMESGDTVLEFGGGARVFAYMANQMGRCEVADIDPNTHPDHLLDVLDLHAMQKLRDKYDTVYCCQVLEHLPYQQFSTALENIAALKPKTICLSLPDNRRAIRFSIRSNFTKLTKVISLPFTGRQISISNHPYHHWEIWSGNEREVLNTIKMTSGYSLEKHYRLFERKYQHFFILRRNG